MRRMILAVVCALLAPGLAGAQSAGNSAEVWRTPWGDPDLQGTWTNTTTTPLERPSEFAGRSVLTDEERAELDAQAAGNRDRPPLEGRSAEWRRRDAAGAYNRFWLDRGARSAQTSLVVDPPDGRVPALTERVRERDAAIVAVRDVAPASFEDMNLYARCITRGMPGAMIPAFYNHNYQILQTPDYVVILVEMIHDARIIPLDGRPHLPPPLRQWLGDSRAHWDGDTLVVETTNFSPKGNERAHIGGTLVLSGSEHAHLVERFTRVDGDTIDYRFTVTDPTTYTGSWTASIPMSHLEAPIFEYACHEGNYGLLNILRGTRAQERVAADTASSR